MGACTFVQQGGSTADQVHFSMNIGKGTGQLYRGVRGILTPSTTYANPAGDTIPLASVGLREVRFILLDPLGVGNGADAFLPGTFIKLAGTPSAPTIRVFVAAGGGAGAKAEVANGLNLTNNAFGVWLLGH